MRPYLAALHSNSFKSVFFGSKSVSVDIFLSPCSLFIGKLEVKYGLPKFAFLAILILLAAGSADSSLPGNPHAVCADIKGCPAPVAEECES